MRRFGYSLVVVVVVVVDSIRLDYITFLVPMQCTDNSGCFPRGKRAAIVRRYPDCFPFLCAVFSCFDTTGCEAYSFTTAGYGIFNVRTHLGACHAHSGGSGTNRSAQELTRMDTHKNVSHPAPPGDRTQGLRICIPTR